MGSVHLVFVVLAFCAFQIIRLGPGKSQLKLLFAKPEHVQYLIAGSWVHWKTGHILRLDPRDMHKDGYFFIECAVGKGDRITKGMWMATDPVSFVVNTTWTDWYDKDLLW